MVSKLFYNFQYLIYSYMKAQRYVQYSTANNIVVVNRSNARLTFLLLSLSLKERLELLEDTLLLLSFFQCLRH